jgi:hypothetical protein
LVTSSDFLRPSPVVEIKLTFKPNLVLHLPQLRLPPHNDHVDNEELYACIFQIRLYITTLNCFVATQLRFCTLFVAVVQNCIFFILIHRIFQIPIVVRFSAVYHLQYGKGSIDVSSDTSRSSQKTCFPIASPLCISYYDGRLLELSSIIASTSYYRYILLQPDSMDSRIVASAQ